MKAPPAMIDAAAAAIANARAGRRGAPAIANVLEVLPETLLAEVREDAEAALEVVGAVELLAALKDLVEDIQITGERWGDSISGPATVALESAPNPITAEVWQQALDAIARAEVR